MTESSTRSERRDVSRILVAEDNREMRRLLTWALRNRGFDVTEASDGPDLFFRLSTQTGTKLKYDLLISDIRMPHMTGLEVMQGLLRVRRLLPPIILITAFGDEQIHLRAADLGATLIDKPFELDDLMKKIDEILAARTTVASEAK